MLKTFLGPVEDAAAVTYLRPETAQGMFVNFENVVQSMRRKLPFGIAQVGRSFRNEITPGNFIFRTREFEQMDEPEPARHGRGRPADEWWHDHWIEERLGWYRRYGVREENLRVREHAKEELAHYAKRTVDVEYRFAIGWSELEDRELDRLRPPAPHRGQRADAQLLRRRAQAARRAVRDRAGGRRRNRTVLAILHGTRTTSRTCAARSASCCGSIPRSRRSRSRCCPS